MITGWRESAACRTVDPELFYPIGNTGPALLQIEKAKRVCWACPVREECLRDALSRPAQHGIWGGLTEDQRTTVRRRVLKRASAARVRAAAKKTAS